VRVLRRPRRIVGDLAGNASAIRDSNHTMHTLLPRPSNDRPGLRAGLVLIGLTACQANQAGHLAALQLGDTTHLAARGSPVDDLRTACGSDGTPTPAGSDALTRRPYLQQVTASAARIGWVTTAPGGVAVELTTPDGAAVRTAPGTIEAATLATAREQQMWARLDGLTPDTIYCYALTGAAGPLTLRTGFRTAPSAEDPAPVRFLAFGDSGGGGADQLALLQQMHTVPYSLILHTGDLAYDHGTIGELEANVFGVYEDLLRNLPMFPVAGNHDYDTGRGAPFREVFALPGDGAETWYSFDWGRVHFAALDTESDYATQAAWLDRDLASTARPWKIVYLHKPPYSSGTHGSDTSLRAALAPILERHRVQLVVAGHDHDYERVLPQRGVVHVVTGGGGVGTRSVGRSSFTAFSQDVIHFVYVEVGLDQLVLHAIDGTGVEFDAVVVPR
jgi:hypothetical protein